MTYMGPINKVIFTDKETKKVLRIFEYPKDKIISKFFWEKMKLEEHKRLCKARDLEPETVIMTDLS